MKRSINDAKAVVSETVDGSTAISLATHQVTISPSQTNGGHSETVAKAGELVNKGDGGVEWCQCAKLPRDNCPGLGYGHTVERKVVQCTDGYG